jgi:hypothetical protein
VSRRLSPPDVLQPCRRIVLTLFWKFPLATTGAPTSTKTRETSTRERGTLGEKLPVTLPTNGDFQPKCRDLLYAANLRHGTHGFTSPPKEGMLGIFSPWKIRRLRPDSKPLTGVPENYAVYSVFPSGVTS